MARFDRYVLSQLFVLFGFASLVLVLVYWINRAVLLFDQLIADGQSAGVFLELTALSLPNLIRIVLPLAAFAATVYVTNRMASESELTVVQATGFSPYRLARPVLVFGGIVAGLMLVLTHVLVPLSIAELTARQGEIARNATARLLREGQFLEAGPGVTLYIREVTAEGEMLDVFLSDTRRATEEVTYTAKRAFLVRAPGGPQLVMIDGLAQTLRENGTNLVTTAFEDLAYDLGGTLPPEGPARRPGAAILTHELFDPSPALVAETGVPRAKLLLDVHERTGEALLAPAAALIGFATLLVGGFSRFGLWRQIVASVFLLILVKLVETGLMRLVGDDPARWPVIYLPALFGLGLGLGLLYWAAHPGLLRRRPRALPGPGEADARAGPRAESGRDSGGHPGTTVGGRA